MNITLHFRTSSAIIERFRRAFPDDSFRVIDSADHEGIMAALPETDVFLHVLKPITAAMLAAGKRLKLVQKIGVGVNTIDLDAAKRHGIAVCNMPGTNSEAVAEQALALLLAVLRRIPNFDARTRKGLGWQTDTPLFDTTAEIAGRRVGLVGMGGSARRLAPALAALGAEVSYTKRHPDPALPYRYRPLDELLQQADILSLHVPLTAETHHMIDARALALLPQGAVLVNTARGELVDQRAMLAALDSGQLRGAGLDVFEEEPLSPENPLLRREDVVLAPHIAWLTAETIERSLGVATENLRLLKEGKALLHRVA